MDEQGNIPITLTYVCKHDQCYITYYTTSGEKQSKPFDILFFTN